MRESITNLQELFWNSDLGIALKEYDHWLLLNYPRLWVIRLHYLILYALMANLLVFLILWVVPLKLQHVSEFFTVVWMIFFATMIFLYLWNRQFRLYSPEKEYENTSPFKGLADYLVYIACLIVIISPSISASFTLIERFDGMIGLVELKEDLAEIKKIEWDQKMPESYVQKYLGLDSVDVNKVRVRAINSDVVRTAVRLEDIKEGDFMELRSFSIVYVVVIHFGLLFSGKHLSKKIFNRALLTAAILFIVYFFYAIFMGIFSFSPTIIGRLLNTIGEKVLVWPGPMILLAVIMAILSVSVFTRKENSMFVSISIFLLPIPVYILLTSRIIYYINETRWYSGMRSYEEFWIDILTISPLVYIWLIQILKAMYMRVLALPEK